MYANPLPGFDEKNKEKFFGIDLCRRKAFFASMTKQYRTGEAIRSSMKDKRRKNCPTFKKEAQTDL